MANEMQKTGGDVARSEAEETRDTGPFPSRHGHLREGRCGDADHRHAGRCPGQRRCLGREPLAHGAGHDRGARARRLSAHLCRIRARHLRAGFSLPDTIDADKIDATHRDGVLTLTLKKSEAAKPKQIKVKAA